MNIIDVSSICFRLNIEVSEKPLFFSLLLIIVFVAKRKMRREEKLKRAGAESTTLCNLRFNEKF